MIYLLSFLVLKCLHKKRRCISTFLYILYIFSAQKYARLHMRVILRHIPTNQQKKYNYLYNMNSSNQ